MRGRMFILLGLIVVGLVAVGAIVLLGGSDDPEPATTDTAATPDGTGATPEPTAEEAVVQESTDFGSIVIVLQDLGRGTLITRQIIEDGTLIGIRNWPIGYIPETAIAISEPDDLEQLIGCRLRTDVPRESPLLERQLVPDPTLADEEFMNGQACGALTLSLSRTGSDAALFLEPGMVAMAVPLDFTGLGQVAYALRPGDRIDVIMSWLFVDVDEEFQTRTPNGLTVITLLPDGSVGFAEAVPGREEPSIIFPSGVIVTPSEEQQRPRLVTQRTIQNALVVYVGWFPPDGVIYGATPTPADEPEVLLDPTEAAQQQQQQQSAPPPVTGPTATAFVPQIMTLGVSPQDALIMTWAIDAQIPVTYVLRPAQPDAAALNTETAPVTLEYILNEFGIEEPPNLPISVEPAITNIRRFDLASLRTFAELLVSE